jgi:ATP-dependent helicase/nuclease subunit B
LTPETESSLFTIPSERSFVDSLARGLLRESGGDPIRLADYAILLPTRRACRALTEAFLRQSDGAALILPRLTALGDTDEDELALDESAGLDLATLPPAVPELRRLMMLSDEILRWRETEGAAVTAGDPPLTPDQAVHLAAELARFLDQVETERLSFDGLEALVPEDLATHWQATLDFLRHFSQAWPARVAEAGYLEPVARRNLLLEHKAEQWRAHPPKGPVLAAGSTGSIPATADLLAAIAALPQGSVVLPGLDLDSDDENWAAIGDDPTHPQWAMAQLLDKLGVTRDAVAVWRDEGVDGHAVGERQRLIREAMRPATTTGHWQHLDSFAEAALDGISLVECANEAEETGVIALILRQVLETEAKTGALVTTDRRLARRVAAALRRWDIEIDDSAGRPLADTPPAAFMRLIAEMAAGGFGPVALLAFAKHPLAACGMAPQRFRSLARAFDRKVLRGPRPAPGIAGLREVLAQTDPRVLTAPERESLAVWLDALEAALAPLTGFGAENDTAPLADFVDAHIAVSEALAGSDAEVGAARLWAGEDGEALAGFFAELRESASALPPVPVDEYPAILDALLGRKVVRPRYGRHPRLHIWGPLEARLQRAHCLIIGGLNEGSWPREPAPDPWLSRPMRVRFGLPLPEQRIGLSAHDFAQGLAAPEIVLTRARKLDGAPTVPTRWLSRLQSVLFAAGRVDGLPQPADWLDWHRATVRAGPRRAIEPPAPAPPVAARPRHLSVTQVEVWRRDPYSIYARHILRLRKLDPLEADPGAADRGILIHEALDRFLRDFPDDLPEDAEAELLRIGEDIFAAALARPAVGAFWWPRFRRIAGWFTGLEAERRATVAAIYSERRGELVIEAPAGPFKLTAIADRIDARLPEGAGGYELIDYKTGTVPRPSEVELGYAPQLPLEAAIAEAGGFEGVDARAVTALSYWRLTGGEPPGEIKPAASDIGGLAAAALAGLTRLVADFDDAERAYPAIPAPRYRPRYSDYDHLERVLEWAGAGEDEA